MRTNATKIIFALYFSAIAVFQALFICIEFLLFVFWLFQSLFLCYVRWIAIVVGPNINLSSQPCTFRGNSCSFAFIHLI